MSELREEELMFWEQRESPEEFETEIFCAEGVQRVLPHHAKWWRYPVQHRKSNWQRYGWGGYPGACRCCCCKATQIGTIATPEQACAVTAQLALNTFGPGKAIHIVRTPWQYYVEFYISWTASGQGQVTVDVDLIQGPVPVPQRIATGRGPSDRVLFSGDAPGTHVFRVTATDIGGNSCFDTVTVQVPRF